MDGSRFRNWGPRRNLNLEESEYNEVIQMRRYYTCSVFIMVTTALLVVILCVCSTDSKEPGSSSRNPPLNCPDGTVPCDTSDVCVNRTKICDHVDDCPDKSDEQSKCDEYHNQYFQTLYEKRPEADRKEESRECVLSPIPKQCECKSKTHLYCENQQLRQVPRQIPWRVTELGISGNKIPSVTVKDFRNLTELIELLFKYSSLQHIRNGTFRHCRKLTAVHLVGNKLKTFSSQIFARENRLRNITLSQNQISVLGEFDLRYLDHLYKLNLARNEISLIESGAFSWTPQLQDLDLSGNKLVEIRPSFFDQLNNLHRLMLSYNNIEYIEAGSFAGMKELNILSLSHNKIQVLKKGTFDGLEQLTMLFLMRNDITTVTAGAFDPLLSLQSVDMTLNPFRQIPKDTFKKIHGLNFIYFEKFYMCAYVQDVVCTPDGDGISSKDNLLENVVLRISVWVVAVLACAGNIVVLLGRFLLKEDNQIHSFFIKNLSLADMLMGIYLLIIGSRDKMYRGVYMFHDEDWRNSWECNVSGILSTVSSEMSVMTLTLITMDRYMSIMYPLSFRKRGLKVAYLAMGSLWTLAILMGVIPVLGLDYFGKSFYSDNAVCIPLHLHDPHVKGWEYSAILILGVNSVSFAFISYAYAAMFLSIQRTAVPLRTTRESRDRCLVKRFFFIVITDFACWVPIIIIKILALSGVKISGDLYAWVVVFVLPVNSALNPLLYTITTKLFKQKLFSKFSSVVWRPQVNKESSQSMSSARANRTSVSQRNALNDVEMQCLRNYRHANGRLASHKKKSILKNKLIKKCEVSEPLNEEVNGQMSPRDEPTKQTSVAGSPP
ncbi:relaxin receptor 2-like [Haliotis rufescens]|uniref:relaxin receptor 2-like n=1 Tax=Haliotis rufescens TaxID=6454 RepID=UPI001EB0752A|nr:relaxin receptor 2-like [Haliotis rufescens]